MARKRGPKKGTPKPAGSGRKLHWQEQDYIDAIQGTGEWVNAATGENAGSGGNVTLIAKRLGISRLSVYNAMERWDSVAQAIEDARHQIDDLAENVVVSFLERALQKDGDIPASVALRAAQYLPVSATLALAPGGSFICP